MWRTPAQLALVLLLLHEVLLMLMLHVLEVPPVPLLAASLATTDQLKALAPGRQ
jgi:hypothetical protein